MDFNNSSKQEKNCLNIKVLSASKSSWTNESLHNLKELMVYYNPVKRLVKKTST